MLTNHPGYIRTLIYSLIKSYTMFSACPFSKWMFSSLVRNATPFSRDLPVLGLLLLVVRSGEDGVISCKLGAELLRLLLTAGARLSSSAIEAGRLAGRGSIVLGRGALLVCTGFWMVSSGVTSMGSGFSPSSQYVVTDPLPWKICMELNVQQKCKQTKFRGMTIPTYTRSFTQGHSQKVIQSKNPNHFINIILTLSHLTKITVTFDPTLIQCSISIYAQLRKSITHFSILPTYMLV